MKRFEAMLRRKKGLLGLVVIFLGLLVISVWSRGTTGAGPRSADAASTAAASAVDGAGPEAIGPAIPDEEARGGVIGDLAAAGGESSPQSMPSLGAAVFKVAGSVVLVVLVLYAGVYVSRSLSRRMSGGSVKADAISVIHKRHIAPKKAIYVVTIGSRAMVVGVTDSQINHLADLTTEEVEGIRVPQPDRAKQFKKHLLSFGFGIDDKTKGM